MFTFEEYGVFNLLKVGHKNLGLLTSPPWIFHFANSLVCLFALWPSQPNGVMLNTVSLPSHTFIRQA